MNLQVSVNKVEGFEDLLSNAGCYLSVDGDFLDVITPITSKSSDYLTEIPSTGLLKFIIKNMRSGDVIGSASINIEKLITGAYWLPIFDDIEDDLVQNISKSVDAPKIEITIVSENTEAAMKPVINSVKADNKFGCLQQEYEAALKRSEDRDTKNLQKVQELAEYQIKFQIEINSLKNQIEKRTLENSHLQERIRKLATENYESQYLKYKDQAEGFTKQIQAYEDEKKLLEQRIAQSLDLAVSLSIVKSSCHFHDEEILKLQQQNSQLKQKILEDQKPQEKRFSDKLEAELIRQIKDLDEKLECSESSKMELISEMNDLKQELFAQEKLINEMKEYIEGSKTERLQIKDDRARSPKSTRRKDSIDRSLEEYHAGQGIKNNFVKFSRGLYEFGNRKVNVSMKNGTIVCRVGGGYVQIDDFLNIYMGSLTNSLKKNYSRNQSTSPLRNTRHNFTFIETASGKQTPVTDSVFDGESILTYSCDSEDEKSRTMIKYAR